MKGVDENGIVTDVAALNRSLAAKRAAQTRARRKGHLGLTYDYFPTFHLVEKQDIDPRFTTVGYVEPEPMISVVWDNIIGAAEPTAVEGSVWASITD